MSSQESWRERVYREAGWWGRLRMRHYRLELAVTVWWLQVLHPHKAHANCQARIDNLERENAALRRSLTR